MKRKLTITTLLFTTIYGLGLTSCGETNISEFEYTYTVIWQNYNGDILEIDRNVKEGSTPTYDGETPTKQGDERLSYTFAGWSPKISEVYENTTYTATYTSSINTFTVTWKNYDGSVLETDIDVPYGTMPSYDGETPKKEGTDDIIYQFTGWTPTINKVVEDITYTATFIEMNVEIIPGISPVISDDKKSVQYGFYPQKHVNDSSLISTLNTLSPTEINGWYLYNDEYYAKETAKIYNNEKYTFDDGTSIVDGTFYWFKCEPIKWDILSDSNGSYYLLSSKLLDAKNYYNSYSSRTINNLTIYPNSYEHSDIRTWLNNDFYNVAFALNNTFVLDTSVDNTTSTTDSTNNQYCGNNTTDKVYLPSYQDYLNADYRFDTDANGMSSTRQCKTTDYARAKGAWYSVSNNYKYNGSYWTRSPSSEYYYCAWNVNSSGYLSTYAVDGTSHCVRPCISINVVI